MEERRCEAGWARLAEAVAVAVAERATRGLQQQRDVGQRSQVESDGKIGRIEQQRKMQKQRVVGIIGEFVRLGIAAVVI